MNPKNTTYIAIDISKATLEVRTGQQSQRFENTPRGIAQLMRHAKKQDTPHIVCEATGGYERTLLEALHEAEITLSLLNPAWVRAFAASEGRKAKTDKIDALMLQRYAEQKQPRPTPRPSPEQRELQALMDHRNHLTEQVTRYKNRLQNCPERTRKYMNGELRHTERSLEQIEAEIRKLVASNAAMQRASQTMQGIRGVGEITVWHILAYLSEITQLGRNQITALAGLAPYNRDSGQHSGKRYIGGGREKVRKCLFMAAKTASVHNEHIQRYYQGLMERGKPYKCAIVAVMRKLLLHIKSLLKKDQYELA